MDVCILYVLHQVPLVKPSNKVHMSPSEAIHVRRNERLPYISPVQFVVYSHTSHHLNRIPDFGVVHYGALGTNLSENVYVCLLTKGKEAAGTWKGVY